MTRRNFAAGDGVAGVCGGRAGERRSASRRGTGGERAEVVLARDTRGTPDQRGRSDAQADDPGGKGLPAQRQQFLRRTRSRGWASPDLKCPMGRRACGTAGEHQSGVPVPLRGGAGGDVGCRPGDGIRRCGGPEGRARGTHFQLGPGLNICRVPVNGRNFEYFGEDPYLAGVMAANWTKACSAEGVVPTIKHFAANNQENQPQLRGHHCR